MKEGLYYKRNQMRLNLVTSEEWSIVLWKCREHIQLKIKQRTIYGAHSEANLGEEPIHYYTSYAYQAIISGTWDWQDQFTLTEQMIRIINSRITTEVEKIKTTKAKELTFVYTDIEGEFYDLGVSDSLSTQEHEQECERQKQIIESSIKGDSELEFFWECIKEGYRRTAIAQLMNVTPRQLDKFRERFLRTVRKDINL
jgi:hypothetical protein